MSGLSKIKTGGLHTGCVSADALATGAVTATDIGAGEISHVKLAADCVDGDNIADNSINSEHYVDGSIDHVHLAGDCVDGDNIADNSINSEHYVDASIDHAHLSDDCVDGDNIAADVALTGNPTATTQSSGNDTTRIATTAFVQAALGGISSDSMTEGNTKAEVVDTGSDGHFKVETEGSERLRVIADGKVGIGTTTPEYTLDVTGTDAIAIPAGTTAQRPGSLDANDTGLVRFNTTTGKIEYWSSTSDTPQWRLITESPINVVSVDYLVVGGGGGGSGYNATYASYYKGDNGSDSVFHTLTAGGGGGGGRPATAGSTGDGRATNGSGGGMTYNNSVGVGNGTGGDGGTGHNGQPYAGGGGGGANGNGANAVSTGPGNGGVGITTTIITAAQATANSVGEVSSGSVFFGGGGAGSDYTLATTAGATGGLGGGADAPGTIPSSNTNQYHGTPNTGGGGAGEPNASLGGGGGGGGGVLSGTLQINTGTTATITVGAGAAPVNNQGNGQGGSGVVILKYPADKTATFSSGVTSSTITDGSNKITFVTATSGVSETVTFS